LILVSSNNFPDTSGEIALEVSNMIKKQNKIDEIISEPRKEKIKQNDLEVSLIEDILKNPNIPEYIISHRDDYAGIYQESKYYNPFIHEQNIV
jgi:hypothetical protein